MRIPRQLSLSLQLQSLNPNQNSSPHPLNDCLQSTRTHES
jgi:hypothetical protein